MLRFPVKVILMCAGVGAVILGAHGLYVYFSLLELLFGGNVEKLFLAIELPSGLTPAVEWMSLKGFQSWFIPAVFVVVGLIVAKLGWQISGGPNIIKKLHLW